MKKVIFAVAIIAIVFVLAMSGTYMSQVPSPSYDVVDSEGSIEIRNYQPMVVAEVNVTGDRSDAIKNGFRQLADYISGKNESNKDPKHSQKIAMTAPVIQMSDNDGDGDADTWIIRFIMPDEFNIDSLPTPKNTSIELVEVPAKRYAVVQFSGTASERNLNKNLDLLEKYLNSNKIQTNGQPIFAFYNPPWTLPFMRRNEIMFEIQG